MLGYVGAINSTSKSYFGIVNNTYSYSNVSCTGTEIQFDECKRNFYSGGCSENEAAGVVCNISLSSTSKLLCFYLLNSTLLIGLGEYSPKYENSPNF
jgi:hypothetical protein